MRLFLFHTLVHWYQFIDSTCVWYLRMFIFSLTYLTSYEDFLVHPCCCQYHFFLFYGWVVFQLEMYHISLHFSVSGHFGGFRVLAIVNSAALKIGMHVSFWERIFSGPKPRNGIAGSYDTSLLSVSRNLHAVFHSGFPICIPTKTVGRFHFLFILCRSFWWWSLWPVWGDTSL